MDQIESRGPQPDAMEMPRLAKRAAREGGVPLMVHIGDTEKRYDSSVIRELLPLLGRMASAEELIRLGNRVGLAEEAAPTRPHPGTPATPPWNKVIDPAVAVVDKVRDVVGRRTTYPRDL